MQLSLCQWGRVSISATPRRFAIDAYFRYRNNLGCGQGDSAKVGGCVFLIHTCIANGRYICHPQTTDDIGKLNGITYHYVR
jgi:hypothetical protein